MGRFQLELIYLYFPPSFHQKVDVSVLLDIRCYNNERPTGLKQQLFDGKTVENKGKLIIYYI